MILPVVKYGDPVLRKKGAKIEKITPTITIPDDDGTVFLRFEGDLKEIV